ncbi:MAG: NUDIX hydrolase [Bacteriovoracaceae bacterium]|nr:NUDIX hydrolase [Bacteriovoracaceae bacterium]
MTTEKIGEIIWERAYLPGGLVIFPVTSEGKILLIRERRPHENPPVRLKPVSGMLDAGESPLECAQRELQEEIGFKATSMKEFWTYKTSGTVNSVTHFFLATGLIPSKLPNPDGEDVIEEIIAFTPDEVAAKVASEEMRWGVSVMGWFKLLQTNLLAK